jgi:hypothetical protein
VDEAGAPRLLREVTEVLAVVPAMHDDFSTEPILCRRAPGAPLEWTGSLPPDTAALERILPGGLTVAGLLDGRSVLR